MGGRATQAPWRLTVNVRISLWNTKFGKGVQWIQAILFGELRVAAESVHSSNWLNVGAREGGHCQQTKKSTPLPRSKLSQFVISPNLTTRCVRSRFAVQQFLLLGLCTSSRRNLSRCCRNPCWCNEAGGSACWVLSRDAASLPTNTTNYLKKKKTQRHKKDVCSGTQKQLV